MKKTDIDKMSFKNMLTFLRFEHIESKNLSGKIGEYFFQKYRKLKNSLESRELVKISKEFGWDDETSY